MMFYSCERTKEFSYTMKRTKRLVSFLLSICLNVRKDMHSLLILKQEHLLEWELKNVESKNILTATYIVESSKEHFTLKDKPGNSLLYFCVEGIINEQTVRIEENWY